MIVASDSSPTAARRASIAGRDRGIGRQPIAAAREQRGVGDHRRAQAEMTGLRIGAVRRRPRIDDDHQLQRRQQVPHLLHLRRLDAIRDDGDAGAGVGEDVADLRRRQRRINRHRDHADRLRREIDEDPLGPALADDGEPVPGGEADRQQAGGALPDRLDAGPSPTSRESRPRCSAARSAGRGPRAASERRAGRPASPSAARPLFVGGRTRAAVRQAPAGSRPIGRRASTTSSTSVIVIVLSTALTMS